MKRHPVNANLKLHYDPYWQGLPVETKHGPLVENYLERMVETLNNSLSDYRRVSAFRFDLRFPAYWPDENGEVITRFFESLKARIEASEERRIREGKRVHRTKVRYVWAKERNQALHSHYHVALFLNKDGYYNLGRYSEWGDDDWMDVPVDPRAPRSNSLADCITDAWANALGCDPRQVVGLVYFANEGVYHLNVSGPDYVVQFQALFLRLSYLAKADTKQYGDGRRSFGCSRG